MNKEELINNLVDNVGDRNVSRVSDDNNPSPMPSTLHHSTKIDQIIPALWKAKQGFSKIIKTSENPFYKSKYADLAAIEKAIAPSLMAHKLFCMQPTNTMRDGDSIFITIETILWHESCQFLSSRADIPYMEVLKKNQAEVQPNVHGMGSMITYFRRYLKLAFLDIITDDDDGNQATHNQQLQSSQTSYYMPTEQEIATLEADIKKLNAEAQKLLDDWLVLNNMKSVRQLNKKRFVILRARVDEKLVEAINASAVKS